jgi:hypothetical protein
MRLLSPKAAPAMAAGEKQADLVEVFKAARRFNLKRDGDGRTPEGTCTFDVHNPQGSFHLLLRVSYLDADDKAHASKISVRRAATSITTASPMAGASGSSAIQRRIGPRVASRSQMSKCARSGRWCRWARVR